jgi:hypothetical protein
MPATRCAFIVLTLTFALAAPAARGETARPAALGAAARERLDRQALALPPAPLAAAACDAAEDLPLWLAGRAGPDPADEARRAADFRDALLAGRPAADTPAAADRVFRKLLAELPPHLKPPPFHFTLTVLDRPEAVAFTAGGGDVYVTRPLLDALLADPDRGEAALAFALADEVGHSVLGHTRRGWRERDCAAALRRRAALAPPPLGDGLGLLLAPPAGPAPFAYSREEQALADCFALHLCCNAGFDQDAALDGLRRAAGDDAATTPALGRLRRLLMERDGLFDDEARFGLFAYDPETGKLARCGGRSVAAGRRPVVFVHGLRGTGRAFQAYLTFFSQQKELKDRPLLVFRFPNNESLSRCGQFLANEMRRVVAEPEGAAFVCHSDGGLVFRWYAEVVRGGFDRAVLLAPPNAGSAMAEMKAGVDLGRSLLELRGGLGEAVTVFLMEGDGAVAYDLHADSLFLRRLGHDARLAARYHVFYGQLFDWRQALLLRIGFAVAKGWLREAADVVLAPPFDKRRALAWVDGLALPEEVTAGDGAVAASSARLADAGRTTAAALHHEGFRFDETVMRQVLESILKEDR